MKSKAVKFALIFVSLISILTIFLITSCSCSKNEDELSIESQVATLQTKVSTLENWKKAMDNKLAGIDDISDIQSSLNSITSSFQLLQNQVNALDDIDLSGLATTTEVEAIIADLNILTDEISQVTDDINALSNNCTAANGQLSEIEAKLSGINADLNAIYARITLLEQSSNENTDQPYAVIDRLRSSGLEMTVCGDGYFAAVVTLYGQNLTTGTVSIEGGDIDKEYLYGQGIKEEWLYEGYNILPIEIETDPGGTDNHIHTIDLSELQVFYPTFTLSGKGTMLVLMVVPESGDWTGSTIVEIEFNGLSVNYSTVIIGAAR